MERAGPCSQHENRFPWELSLLLVPNRPHTLHSGLAMRKPAALW